MTEGNSGPATWKFVTGDAIDVLEDVLQHVMFPFTVPVRGESTGDL